MENEVDINKEDTTEPTIVPNLVGRICTLIEDVDAMNL